MNLSTVALILLAWQLLSDKRQTDRSAPKAGLTDMLSDDVKNVINSAQKLADSHSTQADRAGAIFEIMSNPALQNFANGIFGGMGSEKSDAQTQETPETPKQKDGEVNDEGYRFEAASPASQEFFRPIDDIADTEVKHKLYWFYDNWYNK